MCYNCLDSFTPNSDSTCGEIQLYTCGAAGACPDCAACQDEQVELVNCLSDGVCDTFDCSAPASSPTDPPAVAPSSVSAPSAPPAAAATCEDELNAYATCVQTSGASEGSCVACLTEYLPDVITTCVESEFYTCGATEACPECGDCETEYAALSNCQNTGVCDTIACNSTNPTAPTAGSPYASPTSSPAIPPVSIPAEGGSGSDRCPAEHEDVRDCLATEISSFDAATCEDCVADALKAVPSASGQVPACNDIISGLCPALSSRDGGGCAEWCGPCSDEILSYLACQVDALTSGCELTCRPGIVESSDAPSDVPSAAPSARAGLRPSSRLRRARLHFQM
jgi:hypothetical protein